MRLTRSGRPQAWAASQPRRAPLAEWRAPAERRSRSGEGNGTGLRMAWETARLTEEGQRKPGLPVDPPDAVANLAIQYRERNPYGAYATQSSGV